VAEGVADPRRLAVAGYSYGGYMTCYLTSRDRRFAAAVAGGVIADLTSMTGTSDAGEFLAQFETGGRPWEDPAAPAAADPFTRVDAVTTRTLILQGGADLRCPVGQAEQWHHALRVRGVPTRLVVYPGENHLFILAGRPSHREDWNRRIVEWVTRFAGDAAGPRPEPLDAAHWTRRLGELATKHGVPGAQLGILRLGPGGPATDDLVTAATGVLHVGTGQPATADALFQIGSISKIWTTMLALMLVDEDRLTLDTKVKDVLPDFRLADPVTEANVTIRHLMTHTSGIDGDLFFDTGRGDDCVARYVDLLADVPSNHPLGATLSYCNAGFVLLGRVIEVIEGRTWDEVLRRRLIEPLGLTHTVTLPEEVLLHASALGHVGQGDDLKPAPVWHLSRANGPAGTISSTVADLLRFARLHLAGGVTPDGARLLSAELTRQMTEFQADFPDRGGLADSWGLGWIRFAWSDGHRAFGHDGGTIGQSAFLRLLPEAGLAVALLTNGGHTRDLYQDLFDEVFSALAGVTMNQPPRVPDPPPAVDITPFLGTYERAGYRMEVVADDAGARLKTTPTGLLASLESPEEHPLVALGPGHFAYLPEGGTTWTSVTFYRLADGAEYLHTGVRATPKVTPSTDPPQETT
jgi:CubicO group peptidase (beta-lactamase class C family)